MTNLLLDTHAVLWTDSGAWIEPEARTAIDAASRNGHVLVSPISAWEIGMLVRKRRIVLALEPGEWFLRFARLPGVGLAPLTIEIAAGAALLPDPMHGDPADRILVATACELGVPLVTRDRQIRKFASDTDLIDVVPC